MDKVKVSTKGFKKLEDAMWNVTTSKYNLKVETNNFINANKELVDLIKEFAEGEGVSFTDERIDNAIENGDLKALFEVIHGYNNYKNRYEILIKKLIKALKEADEIDYEPYLKNCIEDILSEEE